MILRILVFWLLVCSYSSKAEEIDTGNLVPPADEWTLEDKASTTQCSYSGQLQDGEVCTGSSSIRGGYNENDGGKIVSDQISLINQGLSIAEIQQGFDYQYGASIESHVSNTNVPSCSNTNGDCKDYFTITVNLSDETGSVFRTHEHTVEMNYVGVEDYSYSQSLSANNYLDVNFQMDIWSVDAGFTTGFYGGIISDPFLSVQYQTVEIITDIIDDIVNDIVFEEIEYEEVSFEVVIEDYFNEDISFEIDFAPIEDLDISIDIPILEDLPEIEVELYAELDEQIIEELPEMIEEMPEEIEIEVVEEQPEEIVEEQPEEIVEEPQEETIEEVAEETVDEPEQEEVEETTTEKPNAREIKQKIAKKIIASQKDKMSVESQTTQLALMIVLADTDFNSYTDKELLDRQFYEDVNLYLDQNMIEDTNLDLFYMDYLGMNKLVDLQWQR
tara:strand:- start:925 stop:2256 length:1332 start_codon:yes stop_codon:yes gene_type:complete